MIKEKNSSIWYKRPAQEELRVSKISMAIYLTMLLLNLDYLMDG